MELHPSVPAFAFAVAVLAAVAGVVQRFKFPALPLFLLAGLVVAPWLDPEVIEPLPTLGLLMLLFSVGLEFGPDRIDEISGRASRAGLVDLLALPVGVALGRTVGLDWTSAVLLGGVVYMSSSAVIAKLIIELRRAAAPESELVLGVLVFEDLAIALVLAFFGGHGGALGMLAGALLVLGYLALARWLAPALARLLEAASDEFVLLLGTAFTVGTAVLFNALGVSEGIGAFLSGVMAAGLGLRDRIEHLFAPVRDLAVALFFLAVGVSAVSVFDGLPLLAVGLVALALLVKLVIDYFAAAAGGLGVRRRVLTSLYMVPRGEFNLVLGALALAHGERLVAQVAVLLVLASVPLGAVLIRFGPDWTRRLGPRKRRAT